MFEDISKVLLITDMDGTFLPASKIPTPKLSPLSSVLKRLGADFLSLQAEPFRRPDSILTW